MNRSNGVHAWRGYIGLSLVWLAILGGALLIVRRPQGQAIEILPPPTVPPTVPPAPSPTPSPLHVDVAGAVQVPGVYTLPAGSIVADAIAAAGGPAADADLDRINKAESLGDGAQVYVPRQAEQNSREPPPPGVRLPIPTQVSPGVTSSRPININTATAEELDSLPGIGPVYAQRIIAGRPYGAIEDLLRVNGIGQAVFDKVKQLITVQ